MREYLFAVMCLSALSVAQASSYEEKRIATQDGVVRIDQDVGILKQHGAQLTIVNTPSSARTIEVAESPPLSYAECVTLKREYCNDEKLRTKHDSVYLRCHGFNYGNPARAIKRVGTGDGGLSGIRNARQG